MAKNNNLHAAKTAKNDEFYTQLSDIEKELENYKDFFNGKVVYCNCDDPRESNFFKFFSMNFERLGLKKLITTGYKKDGHGVSFVYEGDKNGNRKVDDTDVEVIQLQGNGGYETDECIAFLKEADVVVTNPPFSKIRHFFKTLVNNGYLNMKHFLFIGNKNMVASKDIFPYIKNNQLWLGINSPCDFSTPNGEITKTVTGLCRWFTNIPHSKRNQPLDLYRKYNPTDYKIYDNYCAINVDKVAEIPEDDYIDIEIDKEDYPKWKAAYGDDVEILEKKIRVHRPIWGTPVTFLDKYNPMQFEIIWRGGDIEWAESECTFYSPPTKEMADNFKKQDKTWRIQNPYLLDKDGYAHVVYQRIFIKKVS